MAGRQWKIGSYLRFDGYGTIVPVCRHAKQRICRSDDLLTVKDFGPTQDLAQRAAAFQGLTVASFESRMATEITRLIERYGGRPLVAPALREVPLEDNQAAQEFGVRLMTGQIDVLILLTGIGTTTLFDLLKTCYPWSSIETALEQTSIIARGPKPVAALKAAGLQATLTVPEPNTWVDLIAVLDANRPVNGLRVAVQEYGVSNPDLVKALEQRGAEVFPVPIYKWALPEDLGPIRHALDEIIAGRANVILITNAIQVDHVMKVLEQDGKVQLFRDALRKVVIASIGPTASERLRHHHWPVDFEPSHLKMGILVKEVSEQASKILDRKR